MARHMALCSGLVGTIEWPIMYQKPEDSKEQAGNEMIVTPDCGIADYWATTLGGLASDSPKASSVDEQVRTEANDAVASDSQDLTIEGKIETAPADDLVKSDFTLSERISCDTKSAPVDEVYNSVLETIPVGDLVKPEMSVSGEVIFVTDSAPLGNSVADFVSDTNTTMKVGCCWNECNGPKKGISLAVDAVVTNSKSRAKMISTSEEIAQVGTISANGEREIGELIAKAMEKVGKEE
ncbi:hypothetical protein AAG906_038856 [Vitis piasezkii]